MRILHIDTATGDALVSVSESENVICSATNSDQKSHASFLQPAIKEILNKSDLPLHTLDAVSVTSGPGSYTGLRVGMASAKGLCYALKIPLITVGTLEAMARSVIERTAGPDTYYYCPMIEARRMEVFTALYDAQLQELFPPASVILDPLFLNEIRNERQIIFSGDGAKKFIGLQQRADALSETGMISGSALAYIAAGKFRSGSFTAVTHAEPFYVKPFLATPGR